jgi:hypothetical protein
MPCVQWAQLLRSELDAPLSETEEEICSLGWI